MRGETDMGVWHKEVTYGMGREDNGVRDSKERPEERGELDMEVCYKEVTCGKGRDKYPV